MNIDQHVRSVLKHNSSVSLPRLGEFMVFIQTDQANKGKKKIVRTISFNEQSIISRGALEHQLMEKESMNYEEAVKAINEYVENIWSELNTNKTYAIPRIGTLMLNDAYELKFEQDTTSLVDKEPQEIKSSIWYTLLILGVLGLGFLGANYVLEGKPWNSLMALFNQNSDDQDQLVLPIETSNPETQIQVVDSTSQASTETNIIEGNNTTIIETPVIEEPVSTVAVRKEPYLIIVGAFGVEKNAQRFAKDLRRKGYNSASIVNLPGRNVTHVYAAAYANKSDAESALNNIQTYVEPSAWIFEYN